MRIPRVDKEAVGERTIVRVLAPERHELQIVVEEAAVLEDITAVGLRASDDAFGLFVGGSAGLAAQLRGSHGVGDGCDGAVTKR